MKDNWINLLVTMLMKTVTNYYNFKIHLNNKKLKIQGGQDKMEICLIRISLMIQWILFLKMIWDKL